jgi:hypothetical protein
MEIVILDSIAKAYRNSLSNEGIFLQIKKAGVWTTGQWGMRYGDLFQTGQMSYERQIVVEEDEYNYIFIIYFYLNCHNYPLQSQLNAEQDLKQPL